MNLAFTKNKGVIYHNHLKSDNGYTLICPKYSKDMWLIDIEGNIVNRWKMPYLPAGHGVLLENGNFFYGGQFKTHEELELPKEFSALGGILMEVDWDGKKLWELEVPYQHHDFQVTKKNHIFYSAHSPEAILNSTEAKKLKGGLPGTEFNGKIWGDVVYEIDRSGKVLWEWKAQEHLNFKIDGICPFETRAKWPVINSIWICKDGNILLSLRVSNEVVKIDYETGKVIARYGRGELFHQHDARELENGNILVFDNGNHRYGYGPSYSRVVEIDHVTNKIVWEYKGNPPSDFYSAVAGGSERLTNGNTVICDSLSGIIFEVTKDKELVWEYVSPFKNMGIGDFCNMIWRAHRYSPSYPGLKCNYDNLSSEKFYWENIVFGKNANKISKPI